MIHVPVNRVVERGYVGRALDRGMPPEGHHAGAGAADVPEEQLEQRAASDGLGAVGVLGPGHGVRERGGAAAGRTWDDRLRYLEEGFLRTTRDPLDHLGRVSAEVPLHDLENSARVLERLVAARRRREQRAHERVERWPGRRRRRGAAARCWGVAPRPGVVLTSVGGEG